MKYFLLLIPFFIFSCGTDADVPDEDVFEPYQIGTWLVTSAETADWQGSSSKQKADTTHIVSPGDFSIAIERDSTFHSSRSMLVIIDSTYVHTPDDTEIKWYKIHHDFDEIDIDVNHRTTTSEGTIMKSTVTYMCDSEIIDFNELTLEVFYEETGETFRVYTFDFEGFIETHRELAC